MNTNLDAAARIRSVAIACIDAGVLSANTVWYNAMIAGRWVAKGWELDTCPAFVTLRNAAPGVTR